MEENLNGEMKGRNGRVPLKEKFKALAKKIGYVFRDYPVTLGCIVIIAAIGAVIFDCDFDTKLCEKAIVFLAAFALQALFLEEYFRDKWVFRITGYVIAAPVSAFFVFMGWNEDELLFGMDAEKVREIVLYIYISYFSCLGLASVFHMYRRQKERFEVFCLKTFVGIIRTTVVYGLFAGGLALIILIFDALIFKTGGFIARVEIFLAGGIYVPALLLVLSGKKEDVGKFARICVLYVLEPMLLLAMAIIYIYIIKIFVTGDIPSNSVFGIITSLFVAGMVIWTLAQGIGENNVFCRIAGILPFIFVPCIILQAWSILIRIGDYGFTMSRYFGVTLVIFELIYMVLYLLQRLLKKDCVSLLIWVLAAIVVTVLLVPYVNYASVCVRSQVKKLSGITVDESLKDSELGRMAGSAYRVLANDCGYRGQEVVNALYTEQEREILASCEYFYGYTKRNDYYLSDNADIKEMDIEGYKRLTVIDHHESEPEHGIFELAVGQDRTYRADLSGFVNDLKEFGQKRSLSSKYMTFDLDGYGPIVIDADHVLILSRFSASYSSESDTLEYLSIEGYLLEK